MAEEQDKYEEYKKQVKEKMPQDFSLDEEKIKDAFSKGTKVEDLVVSLQKEKPDSEKKEEKEKTDKNKLTINEGGLKEQPSPENVDTSWKEAYYKEWKTWADQNKQVLVDVNGPNADGPLSFRLYENEDKKTKGEFSAELSYNNPYNVSLKGYNEQIPEDKYFDKIVQMAKANGTAIEFGDIKTPEFKAKLWAACLRNKVDAVNTPGKEEFQQWPKNLQEQVTKAFKEGGAKSKDNEKEKDEEKKTSKPKTGAERITELRQKIGELEKAEQAAKAAGGKLEEKDKYAILGLTKEEIEIRKLRGQAQKGDIKAQIEVDKRRHKTMTDEYKYEREVELDDKGQPKKDENGKPVYKRDKDGNFVYKTNEKGQKIKTAAFQAFYNRVKANQGKGSK